MLKESYNLIHNSRIPTTSKADKNKLDDKMHVRVTNYTEKQGNIMKIKAVGSEGERAMSE